VTAFQGDGAGGDEAEAGAGPMEAPAARDRYDVRLRWGDDGWAVEVVESVGPGVDVVVFARACAGEAEARTFASTVHQHLHWLSEAKFREYYRLDGSAAREG